MGRMRKYFPNRIKEWMAIDATDAPFMPAEAVFAMTWKLRPGKNIIVRGRLLTEDHAIIEERSFKLEHAAQNYMWDLETEGYEVTVATPDMLAIVGQKGLDFLNNG